MCQEPPVRDEQCTDVLEAISFVRVQLSDEGHADYDGSVHEVSRVDHLQGLNRKT